MLLLARKQEPSRVCTDDTLSCSAHLQEIRATGSTLCFSLYIRGWHDISHHQVCRYFMACSSIPWSVDRRLRGVASYQKQWKLLGGDLMEQAMTTTGIDPTCTSRHPLPMRVLCSPYEEGRTLLRCGPPKSTQEHSRALRPSCIPALA